MHTSFRSKMFRCYIRLKGIKTRLEKDFKSGEFDEQLQKPADIPEKVRQQCDVLTSYTPEGRMVWELRKKDSHPKRFIFYVHGGGFVYNITKYDWILLNKIIQATDYAIVIPDYPLTPRHNYKDVHAMMLPVYQHLLEVSGSENIVAMGFSAGAALLLSLTQYVQKHWDLQPAKVILISPLLDATLQNPEIKVIDKYDPYLGIKGTKIALAAYAGGDDLSNYLISPINGNFNGLVPVHLFCGTHEITLPDVRKLVSMAERNDIPITYYEYPKMYHAWVFLNMPEAESFFNELVRILSNNKMVTQKEEKSEETGIAESH